MMMSVRVMVLKDLGKTFFSEVELTKGIEIDIPRWVAEVLEKKGLVKVLRRINTLEDLNKIAFQETIREEGSRRELYKVSPDLYFEIEKLVEEYKSRIDSRDPRVYSEFSKLLTSAGKLIRSRFRKIFYIIQVSEAIDEEVEKRMTIEERVFYRNLLRSIVSWIRGVEKILGVS
ncbi:MAG: hypothetical protein ACP5GI_03425 [Sulfolobales archaeon]